MNKVSEVIVGEVFKAAAVCQNTNGFLIPFHHFSSWRFRLHVSPAVSARFPSLISITGAHIISVRDAVAADKARTHVWVCVYLDMDML